jgi:hypothetical protein
MYNLWRALLKKGCYVKVLGCLGYGLITIQTLLIFYFVWCVFVSCSCRPSLQAKEPSLQLIDMGRGIDMTLFPEGTTFNTVVSTKDFQCIEMQTKQPWTYQVNICTTSAFKYPPGHFIPKYCQGLFFHQHERLKLHGPIKEGPNLLLYVDYILNILWKVFFQNFVQN